MLISFGDRSGLHYLSVSKYFIAACIFLFFETACQRGFAQCNGCADSPAMNVLSAHDNSGRGCLGCHTPHHQSWPEASSAGTGDPAWGGATSPVQEHTVTIGKRGRWLKLPPAPVSASSEIAHILLCLSCHDGNIAPENMMANQPYEESGLVGNAASRPIPTLRGKSGWIHSMEHPLGPDAVIPVGNGLQFVNGEFSVVPGSRYAEFVANYGWPTLAPVRGARWYGITADGRPYVLCTTCHNPHGIDEYVSRPESPIAGDGGGRHYTTFFSLNAPYNPNTHNMDGRMATSNVQFCRQCHFDLSNEANNTFGIHTIF